MVINCTPHEVTVICFHANQSRSHVWPPCKLPSRVEVVAHTAPWDPALPFPTVTHEYGDAVNLPPPVPGTWYIVSAIMLAACPNRMDLLAPDTSPESAIRSPDGKIIAVRRFVRNRDNKQDNRK